MEIKFDKEFEVTKSQYNILMKTFAGVVAGRISNNTYFIKVWMMKYKIQIQNFLELS